MSLLDIIPGGSYLQSALATASTKITAEKNIVTGKIGKVYYGAVSSVDGAIASTAQTAQNVAAKVTSISTYAFMAIGFVVLWPFIAPLLADAFSTLWKKGNA